MGQMSPKMSQEMKKAGKLLTQKEFDVFFNSQLKKLVKLSEKELKNQIKYSRTRIRKFVDLKRRQMTAGAANRTIEKLEVFKNVLSRFQSELEKRQTKVKNASGKPKKPPTRKKTLRSALAKRKPKKRGQKAVKAKAARRKINLAGQKRIQSHIRSSGQRAQKKRDRRS